MFGKKKTIRYNIDTDVREDFLFLEKAGFVRTKLQRNEERNYVYLLNSTEVLVIIDTYKYSCEVIITKNNTRSNIINCQVFDESQRARLNETIKSGISSLGLSNKIKFYAEFLQANIKSLISNNDN